MFPRRPPSSRFSQSFLPFSFSQIRASKNAPWKPNPVEEEKPEPERTDSFRKKFKDKCKDKINKCKDKINSVGSRFGWNKKNKQE